MLILESWSVGNMVPSKQPLFHKNILWFFSSKCFRTLSWAWVPLHCHITIWARVLQNVFCRVPSHNWNKLLRKEKPFIEHNLLTPVRGSNRKRMQRSSLSLPCLEQLWPGEPCHILGQRGGEGHTPYVDDIWKKRQSSPRAFPLLLKTKHEVQ